MDTTTKNLVVRQSNDLIEASYKIASIGEGRLIRMLIAQINVEDEDFKTYRIATADFAKFFNITSKSVNEQVENAARALRDREIALISKGRRFYTGWLASAEYMDGEGYVEVTFHARLKPYLLGLKGYFTQYELEKVVNFKSGYSMRLFELLKMEQFKADAKGYFKRSFEYDELRELLGIEKKEYTFFANFKVKAIDVAVKEINANPNISVIKVDYPKTGRKVSHVVFHCEKPKQLQLDIDEPAPKFEEVENHPEYIKQLVAFGISEETAYKWKRKYGVARITRNLGFVTGKKNAGKVKDDLAGYVASAIAQDYGQGWEDKAKIQQEDAKTKQKDAETAKQKEAQEKQKSDALWAEFLTKPDTEKDEFIRHVLAEKTASLDVYEKKGIASPLVRGLILPHLRDKSLKQ